MDTVPCRWWLQTSIITGFTRCFHLLSHWLRFLTGMTFLCKWYLLFCVVLGGSTLAGPLHLLQALIYPQCLLVLISAWQLSIMTLWNLQWGMSLEMVHRWHAWEFLVLSMILMVVFKGIITKPWWQGWVFV